MKDFIYDNFVAMGPGSMRAKSMRIPGSGTCPSGPLKLPMCKNQNYTVSSPDLFLGLVLVAKALKSISTGGGHEDAGVAEYDKFRSTCRTMCSICGFYGRLRISDSNLLNSVGDQ
jgi:hypothetical protein